MHLSGTFGNADALRHSSIEVGLLTSTVRLGGICGHQGGPINAHLNRTALSLSYHPDAVRRPSRPRWRQPIEALPRPRSQDANTAASDSQQAQSSAKTTIPWPLDQLGSP